MGPSVTSCTTTIYGFGDSTAGPIWRGSLKPSQPLFGGYERATNYPHGESLYSPVAYASLVQTVSLTALSKVAGPVCAYNIYNFAGYITTAILMFAFIWYLIKSRWIALLAGYAVAFTPYVQSKIGGHPSYGFASLLIAIVWLLLHIVSGRGRLRHGLLLAVVLAICAYFDPYFILLAGTVVVPIIGWWGVRTIRRVIRVPVDKQKVKKISKILFVSLAIFLVLVGPLVLVRVKDSVTINSDVSGARGNVYAAAMLCSNMPLDYLLPDPYNVYFVSMFGQHYTQANISHRHWCGPGESRVSISLTILGVILLGSIIMAWEKLNRRHTHIKSMLRYDPWLVVPIICLVVFTAFAIGLPPKIGGVHMPSGVILKVTETWRIFAREYLVVNMAIIMLFAVVLKYFSSVAGVRRYVKAKGVIFVILCLAISWEYQVNAPFNPPAFSYSKDVPSIYYKIRDDKNINAIAEYPIDRMGIEYDSIVYYLTMQTVHKKSILNSDIVNGSDENIHIAIKDLTDPQTIPALRELGIHYVVIHGVSDKDILANSTQLQILGDSPSVSFSLQIVRPGGTKDSVLARIVNGPKVENILTFKKGFVANLSLIQSPMNTEFEALQNTELAVTPLTPNATSVPERMCFDVKAASVGESDDLTVKVNGSSGQTMPISNTTYTAVSVIAKRGDTILLHNSKGYNMQLNNLGCRQ